jgi:glycine cleavage system H lipoate-binding protein
MKKIITILTLSQLLLLADGNIEVVPSHNENPPKDYSKKKTNDRIEKVKTKTASDVTKISSDKVNDINAKLKALKERINNKTNKLSSLKKIKIQESSKAKVKVKKTLKRIRIVPKH